VTALVLMVSAGLLGPFPGVTDPHRLARGWRCGRASARLSWSSLSRAFDAAMPGVSVGNAIGGNNFNLGRILGSASASRPLDVPDAGLGESAALRVIDGAARPVMAHSMRGTRPEGLLRAVACLGAIALALRP